MGILRFSWKNSAESVEPVLGILAFEVAGLMSKVVNLWYSLSDKEILRLGEQIADSVGVKRFVSDDEDYLMELALEEIIENFGCLSRSVVRLSKRCKQPVYHRLEEFYMDPVHNDFQWFGWAYKWKKMEKKVKKMERFVAVTMQLLQEQDVSVELEQTLRRMQANAQSDRVKLLEFQQKVIWQCQEVRNLRGMSPWVRTYDYVVRLMARSLFTILERIKLVFGPNQMASEAEMINCQPRNSDYIPRTNSFAVAMHSFVHPSETNVLDFSAGPPRSITMSGITSGDNIVNERKQEDHCQSSAERGKYRYSKSKRQGGSFSGCMIGGIQSPIVESCKPTVGGSMRLIPTYKKNIVTKKRFCKAPLSSSDNIYFKLALFHSNSKLFNVRAYTLGDAALALHYANIIILIEKLASSPHLISPNARDDLYAMLPRTIRTALRAKLKSCAITMGSSVYNPALAAEWNEAMLRILEWLAPLAHNTIRWHSERNIEKQHEVSRTNILLVLTLFHANQVKTEAAITELLLGLNYFCRIGGVNEMKVIREQAIS